MKSVEIACCVFLFAGLAADAAHLIGGYSGSSRYIMLLPAADTYSAQWFSSMPYYIPNIYDPNPIQQQAGDYRNTPVVAGRNNNIISLDADSSSAAVDNAPDRDQRQIQIRYRPGYKKG